jgi:CubicO group peptidase (beta-lactamase class C family)
MPINISRRTALAAPLAIATSGWMAGTSLAEPSFTGIDKAACRAAGVNPAAMVGVSDHFSGMIGDSLHPGAQLAVVKNDHLLAFFAAGHDDDNKPVDRHSVICMLSCTKLLATLVMAHLHDQGVFEFDDKIAKHWPEFAANGKQDITIAQLMSHRAGLASSVYGDYGQWQEWDKPGGIEKLIVDMSPVWPPGTANGYHALTFGHVVESLVRRWTKKTTGEVLREQITGPLGIKDVYLGLPRDVYDTRYAKLMANDFAQRTNELNAAGFTNPPDAGKTFFNSYMILKQSLPWGGGVANAADFAQLLGVYANKGTLRGKTIFSAATFDYISTPTNKPEDVDRLLKRHVHWGTGVMIDQSEGVGIMEGPVFGVAASPRTVGHLGGSSAMAWADPQNQVSLVFLSTRAPPGPKYQALSNVVRAAIG